MSSQPRPSSLPSATRSLKLGSGLFLLVLAMVFGVAACGADDVADGDGAACSTDTDCSLGSVCSVNGNCVESACRHCLDGQICYRTADNPDGTCSAPECASADDCNGQECIEGQCGGPPGGGNNDEESCDGDEDCPTGQSCQPLSGTCVDDDNSDNNNDNENPCDNVTCDAGQVCEQSTGDCVDDGNQTCDLEAADCTGSTPFFDDQNCECVECSTSSNCSGDQTCQGGSCVDPGGCATPCDPGTPGICGGNTPYCVDECCAECIGGGDCAGSQLCIDGACQEPSGCTDASDCPTGYECTGGQCEAPQTGQQCSSIDDCPTGTQCDPTTNTCTQLGGDFCGLCNEDCTCPGDLTCDGGFICSGCEVDGLDFSGGCPSGNLCLEGICIPLGF